jgi:hypothetical protein
MSIQHEFNNNGVDHHVDLKNRNGHRREKTWEKQNELSLLMKHFEIGTKR